MEISSGKHISFIVAGKCETQEDYEHLKEVNPYPPRFGRNWWTWKLIFENHFKNKEIMNGINITWLCFCVDYTDYNGAK